jgi:hypothetical protein
MWRSIQHLSIYPVAEANPQYLDFSHRTDKRLSIEVSEAHLAKLSQDHCSLRRKSFGFSN